MISPHYQNIQSSLKYWLTKFCLFVSSAISVMIFKINYEKQPSYDESIDISKSEFEKLQKIIVNIILWEIKCQEYIMKSETFIHQIVADYKKMTVSHHNIYTDLQTFKFSWPTAIKVVVIYIYISSYQCMKCSTPF